MLRSKTVTHTLAALFSSDNVTLAKHNAIAKTSMVNGTTLWESVKLEVIHAETHCMHLQIIDIIYILCCSIFIFLF